LECLNSILLLVINTRKFKCYEYLNVKRSIIMSLYSPTIDEEAVGASRETRLNAESSFWLANISYIARITSNQSINQACIAHGLSGSRG